MSDISIGDVMFVAGILLIVQAAILFVYLLARKMLTGDRFKRFVGIFLIGTACSLIPFGFLSVIFGAPAIFMTAILVSFFLDKEKP